MKSAGFVNLIILSLVLISSKLLAQESSAGTTSNLNSFAGFLQSLSCPAQSLEESRAKYQKLKFELRVGMKKIGELGPIDASQGVSRALVYGARLLTDNAEMYSEVPELLALKPSENKNNLWMLAYLIETKNWPLGTLVVKELSLQEEFGLSSFPPENPPSMVDDLQFAEKVAARIGQAGLLNTELNEYISTKGTPSGLIPMVLYSSYVPNALSTAGPFVRWILSQQKGTLSLIQLYQGAIKIYGDPSVAASVISYVLWMDNAGIMVRKKTGVITSKIGPIFQNDPKTNGSLYHLWGYFRRTISGDSPTNLSLLSYGHEMMGQGDSFESAADHYGIKLGKILLKTFEKCNSH